MVFVRCGARSHQQSNEETTMKRKIAISVLSAAIVLGSASVVLAGPIQTWEDIANAKLAVQREIARLYGKDAVSGNAAYASVAKHKPHVSHEQTRDH
jgi:hypothetical protein